MNEAETRAEHIDPALKAAGWGVVDGSRVLRGHGITQGRLQGGGKRAKADLADYVLVYRNTKLAVIEAKAWDKPCTEGVGQAKSYAGTRVPVKNLFDYFEGSSTLERFLEAACERHAAYVPRAW